MGQSERARGSGEGRPRVLSFSFGLLALSGIFLWASSVVDTSVCPPPTSPFQCMLSSAWLRQLLPAALEFLARLAALIPAGVFVAAQVSPARWAQPIKVVNWLSRNHPRYEDVDTGPIRRLLDTLRGLQGTGMHVEQGDAFLREALALAESSDEKDREAFEALTKGKGAKVADTLAERFATDIPRLRQAARFAAPYDALKAQGLFRKLLDRDRDDAEAGYELGLLELQLGERAIRADDLSVAETALQEAMRRFDAHGAGKATDAGRVLGATARLRASEVALARGAFDAAADRAGRALDVYTHLADKEPSEAKWQKGIVEARLQLAEIAIAQGKRNQASGHYEGALAAVAFLARQKPGSEDGRRLALELHEALAELARHDGDLRAAQQHSDEAVAISERPSEPGVLRRERLARRLDRINRAAGLAVDAGDLARAQKRYQDALDLLDTIRKGEPGNLAWRERRADVLTNLAAVTALAGGLTDARKHYHAALELTQALEKDAPDHFSWRWQRFLLHAQLARVATAQGDRAEAAAQVKLADEVLTAMTKRWSLHPTIARAFSDFRIAQPEPRVRVDFF